MAFAFIKQTRVLWVIILLVLVAGSVVTVISKRSSTETPRESNGMVTDESNDPKTISQGLSPIDVSTIQSKVHTHSIVHTKSVLEGEPCSKFEMWNDLSTGDKRIEAIVPLLPEHPCRQVINIIDGESGTNLALYPDPSEYRAKWIDKKCDEYGLDSSAPGDPFTAFKQILETPPISGPHGSYAPYSLVGTSTVNEKEVYVVRLNEPSVPSGYSGVIYYDVKTFFPIKSEYYFGSITRISHLVIGEIVDRDTLPADFFEQIIPKDFTVENACD